MNADEFSDALKEIADELVALSEPGKKIAELAAPKIQELLEQGIAQGVGPDGQPWEPLKKGARVPFSSPKRARDAVRPTVTPVGRFLVVRVSGWANVHQNSRRASLPQRRFVPKEGLTVAWEKALDDATKEAAALLAPKLSDGGGVTVK